MSKITATEQMPKALSDYLFQDLIGPTTMQQYFDLIAEMKAKKKPKKGKKTKKY